MMTCSRPRPVSLLSTLLVVFLGPVVCLGWHPISNLTVYYNQTCSGALFTLDTTWMSYGSLTNSQVQLGTGITGEANCVTTSLPTAVKSAQYSCGISAYNQSVLWAYEWLYSSTCSNSPDNQYSLYQYNLSDPCYTGYWQYTNGSTGYFVSTSATVNCLVSSNGATSRYIPLSLVSLTISTGLAAACVPLFIGMLLSV